MSACPKCGAKDSIKRNGSGRTRCTACGATSTLKLLALKGHSPAHDMTHTVPDGFNVKGVSTLYDADGKVSAQWVKSTADDDRRIAMQEAYVEGLARKCKGYAEPIKAPTTRTQAKLLSAYIIGDAHFGMYAWAAEAGDNFDTDIASRDLRAAIDRLVEGAPASETGYLVDVGDFLHADNRTNATPGGTPLDFDTRFQRVCTIAQDALVYCVGKLLGKHKRVKLFCNPGNHNPDSAGWMARVLRAYFRNEPRVEVEVSPSKFYYQRFGKVLIGITHGDKAKMQNLPAVMAADRPKDWGATEFRYWWTGHIHHTKHQEYPGCFVESFNTLAAGDAWHNGMGYRAARQMQRIDIDAEEGIYGRAIAGIKMLRAA